MAVDQPSAPALTPGGTPDPEIVLSDLRWPFAELGAQGVPPTLPVAKGPVQLTLSLLAALRNGVPTLVQYDDAGRVLATGDRVAQGPYVTAPTTTQDFQVNLAVGTESIELKVRNEDYLNASCNVGVSGVDSGWIYYPDTQLAGRFTTIKVQVDHAQDSAVQLEVTNNSAAIEVAVLVTLVKAVDEVTILSNPGQEATVHLAGRYLAPVDVVKTANFNIALAPGATLDLVAAILGQTIRVLAASFGVIVAGNAQVALEDDAGVEITQVNTSITGVYNKQLFGAPVSPNHKLRWRNFAGAATPTLAGDVVYLQA